MPPPMIAILGVIMIKEGKGEREKVKGRKSKIARAISWRQSEYVMFKFKKQRDIKIFFVIKPLLLFCFYLSPFPFCLSPIFLSSSHAHNQSAQ